MKHKHYLHQLNPQDLVDKERSFLKIIKSGVLQILAITGKDAVSKSELEKLHYTILEAIKMLLNIYDMELKKVPTDSEIVKNNIIILNKIKSLFIERKYDLVNKLLNKLQS